MSLRDMIFGKPQADVGFSPLSQAQKDRQALFALYWRYYRGFHRKPLKVRPDSVDDNVILNLSKRVVNKGVQFLFGKPLDFQTDEDQGKNTLEEYLDQVWGIDEERHTKLQAIGLNGAVTGTPVIRLYEPDPSVNDGVPRIVNLDPSLLDIICLDDDVEVVQTYLLTWKSGEIWKRHRFDMQENDTWLITEQIAKLNSPDWQIVNETAWLWPFAPIATGQNLPNPNEFWGLSDLEEADINDAINFTASNINRILKFHSHPKTIGTGFSADQLMNTSVDEFWAIPDPAARVANLEMQSDLASAYNYLALLKNTYAKVTGVPDLDPAQVNVGALSGFALRILYGDLLEATQTKRNTYGEMIGEVNERALALGGLAEYGSVRVKNIWQDPLPNNDKEQAEALQIDKANGLSTDTYLERRGYDPEQEAEKRQADQAEQQAQLGTALTDAMRNFDQGNGKSPMPAMNGRGNA
jgi:hypothetical protein